VNNISPEKRVDQDTKAACRITAGRFLFLPESNDDGHAADCPV